MTWGRDLELNGVMNPREPIANGTIGGTGSLPIVLQAHSSVPSPPSVATKSTACATAGGHSVQSAALTPIGGCHVAARPHRHVVMSPCRCTCTPPPLGSASTTCPLATPSHRATSFATNTLITHRVQHRVCAAADARPTTGQ